MDNFNLALDNYEEIALINLSSEKSNLECNILS